MFLLSIDFSELGSNTLEILILLLITAIIAYFIGRLGRVPQSEYYSLNEKFQKCNNELEALEEEKLRLLGINAEMDKEMKQKITDNNQLRADHEQAKTRIIELELELGKCRKQLTAKQSGKRANSSKEETLERIKSKAADINFDRIGTATINEKDPLQKIKGIGPFIEQKLNAIGIYTFQQISKFTAEDEDMVNKAIEFFPGRVKRDDWRGQAQKLQQR